MPALLRIALSLAWLVWQYGPAETHGRWRSLVADGVVHLVAMVLTAVTIIRGRRRASGSGSRSR
jgi:hypothetical protein